MITNEFLDKAYKEGNLPQWDYEKYKEEINNAISELPKENNVVSAYCNINVSDLNDAMDRFKCVPSYQDLLDENKKLIKEKEETQKKIDRAINVSICCYGGNEDYYMNTLKRIRQILQESVDKTNV